MLNFALERQKSICLGSDPVILTNTMTCYVERTREEYDLFDASSGIFNCNETECAISIHPQQCWVMKGQHHPRAITSGNKLQTAVLACANAAGYHIPLSKFSNRRHHLS